MNSITNQNVAERIMQMVNTFNKIEVAHVYRMFEGEEDARIGWCIKALKNEGRIAQDPENLYIAKHKKELEKQVDQSMMDAIWTMLSFGNDNITHFYKLEYPKHIIFIVKAGEKDAVYELSAIPNREIATAKAILTASENKNDHAINVAIVEDKAAGKALIPYGYDAYCILNEEKKPVFYQE